MHYYTYRTITSQIKIKRQSSFWYSINKLLRLRPKTKTPKFHTSVCYTFENYTYTYRTIQPQKSKRQRPYYSSVSYTFENYYSIIHIGRLSPKQKTSKALLYFNLIQIKGLQYYTKRTITSPK